MTTTHYARISILTVMTMLAIVWGARAGYVPTLPDALAGAFALAVVAITGFCCWRIAVLNMNRPD